MTPDSTDSEDDSGEATCGTITVSEEDESSPEPTSGGWKMLMIVALLLALLVLGVIALAMI